MTTDWRQNKTTQLQRSTFLLNNDVLSDVAFMVGPEGGEQQKLFAHRFLLVMNSQVFEAMFYGELAEKSEVICVPDVTPQAFLTMLRFIYTDAIKLECLQHAIETCYVAKKYLIAYLQEQCQNYIENQLTAENACQVYEYACLMDAHSLMLRCLRIFNTETDDVLESECFKGTELQTVETIVRKSSLSASSEFRLFNYLLEWAKTASIKKGQTPDPVNLRITLNPLLPYVRFLVMSPTEFTKGPIESGILTPEEAYPILVHLVNRDATIVSMPATFSSETKRRSHPPEVFVCSPFQIRTKSSQKLTAEMNVFAIRLSARNSGVFVMGVRLPLRSYYYGSKLDASVDWLELTSQKETVFSNECVVYPERDAEIRFAVPMYLEESREVEILVHFQEDLSSRSVECFHCDKCMPRLNFDGLEFVISSQELERLNNSLRISEILFYY